MLRNIFRRYWREPLAYVAVLVFAAVLTVILCHLQRAHEAEQQSFHETYLSVPVYFSVTDLDGTRISSRQGISPWVADMFFQKNKLQPNISQFVKDLKIRLEISGIKGAVALDEENSFESYVAILEQAEYLTLAGISSVRVAEELTPEFSGDIRWYEGYGQEIFETEELVCLVPEEYEGDEVAVSFFYDDTATGEKQVYTCTLSVIGRYTDLGNSTVYCPYFVVNQIYNRTYQTKRIRSISATLVNNNRLDELKSVAAYWFAEPNPLGESTEWGKFGYEYYPYALDINDRLLQELVDSMENSLTINRLASALIFAMSALAGFLTGYLVIRSRKREIALMRTLGCCDIGIYIEFALEQLLCLLLGVFLGGGYAIWQPLDRLLLFVVINFAGLSTALIVFLRANLLVSTKEDES